MRRAGASYGAKTYNLQPYGRKKFQIFPPCNQNALATQNPAFCLAKPSILHCKTQHIARQNACFRFAICMPLRVGCVADACKARAIDEENREKERLGWHEMASLQVSQTISFAFYISYNINNMKAATAAPVSFPAAYPEATFEPLATGCRAQNMDKKPHAKCGGAEDVVDKIVNL